MSFEPLFTDDVTVLMEETDHSSKAPGSYRLVILFKKVSKRTIRLCGRWISHTLLLYTTATVVTISFCAWTWIQGKETL